MTSDQKEAGSNGSPLPGPGAGFTFLYYFSMTIVIVVLAGSQGLNLPVGAVELYRYGLILGLLAGGIGTYFNRTTSFEISAKDISTFKTQFEQILAASGFELDANATEQQEDFTVYSRSGLAGIFSGRVFVAYRGGMTQVVSRASVIRRLRQSV